MSVAFPGAATYAPGVPQKLVVTISDSSQRRWGFQLTARQATSSTTQGGTFTAGTDGYTQLACTSSAFRSEQFGGSCSGSSAYPLEYIEHTLAGTRMGQTGSAQFTFTWTPPANATGSIVIYVAGNAANGDGNTTGDHIYTAKYTLTQAANNAPAITSGGIVNGAGYQPQIAAGSWVSIVGNNLSTTSRLWGPADFNPDGSFPTSLDGVSVMIDGNPAFVEYISPTQINVQAPTDSATGIVGVQVTNSNGTSPLATVTLQAVSPAFFLWAGKYAAATRVDFSDIGPTGLFPGGSPTVPAHPGDTIILWGTGFGPTSPAVPAGQPTPASPLSTATNPVTITIGNIPATILGQPVLTPGDAGLYQIAVQVPTNAPSGDLPVVAQTAGVQSPANVFLTVQ